MRHFKFRIFICHFLGQFSLFYATYVLKLYLTKKSNDLVILLRSLNFTLPKKSSSLKLQWNCPVIFAILQRLQEYFRSISEVEIFWQKISIVTWLWNITAGAATTKNILWKEIFGCNQGNRLYELNSQYY